MQPTQLPSPAVDEQDLIQPKITPARIMQALDTQMRVIGALVLRETKTRYGEYKIGFLWAFIEPMLLVLVVSAIFKGMGTHIPSGMPMIVFMITGFVPFTIFRETMSQLLNAISANSSLLAFPQVTTFDVIVARALLELAVLMSVFAILLLGAAVFGNDIKVENPLGVLAGCALLSISGLGIGFAVASLSPILPSIRQFVTAVLGRPLFLASGLFYTAETLPPSLRDILLHNPLLHMIELIRSAYFIEFESRYASWNYATISAFTMLAFGLIVHQALRKRAIVGL